MLWLRVWHGVSCSWSLCTGKVAGRSSTSSDPGGADCFSPAFVTSLTRGKLLQRFVQWMSELGGNRKVIPGTESPSGTHPAPSIVDGDGCKHIVMLSHAELAAAEAKGKIFHSPRSLVFRHCGFSSC